MTIKSGILKADVDKNDPAITQFLVVVDQKTGEQLQHPRLDRPAQPFSVDVAGGQIGVHKLDDDGRIVHDGDEVATEIIAGLEIELHWLDETPEWIVAEYSNQALPEFQSAQAFSDTNAGGENDPDAG